MARNPFTIALLAAGGISLVLAFMAANVVAQMTDYTSFDTFEVGMVVMWMQVLIMIGVVALTGATVITGAAWATRRGNLPVSGAALRESAHNRAPAVANQRTAPYSTDMMLDEETATPSETRGASSAGAKP